MRFLETWDPLEQVAEWFACNLHMKAVGVAACRLGTKPCTFYQKLSNTPLNVPYLVVVQVATRNYIQDQGVFTVLLYLLIGFQTVF